MSQTGRSYQPVVTSCALVRRDVSDLLATFGLAQSVVETVVLIANELATNAVEHANTQFRLVITLQSDSIQIALTDRSQAPPRLQPHNTHASRGRGLQVVDGLSSAWIFTIGPTGKTITADVSTVAVEP